MFWATVAFSVKVVVAVIGSRVIGGELVSFASLVLGCRKKMSDKGGIEMADVDGESTASPRPARVKNKSDTGKRLRSAVDNQRAEFLRRCRARIKPSDLGLPEAQRKRTAGLRREDVAALSGVSASWYTWLEQGRDMRVSDDVLERLCRTLRLSEDERTYLFSLVQQRLPRVHRDGLREEAPPDVVRMINSLNTPAIAMNLRWDVLAWNRVNSLIFRDYGAIPLPERNLLEILLTRPVHHLNPEQLENTAQRLIARLRFDYSKCADDPRFEALVRRLNTLSPLFNRIWRTPEFTLRAFGIHKFTHPRYGEVAFEHNSCVPDGYPHIRVVICTPDNAAARRAIELASAEIAKSSTENPVSAAVAG
jgi:transcriptional regulator with XRE-family HTH domain